MKKSFLFMQDRFVNLLVLCLTIGLLSCMAGYSGKGVIKAPLVSQEYAENALKFNTVEGKSVIYLFRVDPRKDLRALLSVDGQVIGYNIARSCWRFEIDPGEHELISKFEYWNALTVKEVQEKSTKFVTKSGQEASIHLKTYPGKIYFIRQYLAPFALRGRLDFELVTEKEAQQAILNPKYGYKFIDLPSSILGSQRGVVW